jgi:protein tyrosine/serine phosphatase
VLYLVTTVYFCYNNKKKMSEIEHGLWIGNRDNSNSLLWLDERGIKTVINCGGSYARPGWVGSTVKQHYYEIEADDSLTYPLLKKHYLEFHDMMEDAERRGGGILVHCFAGINRSATLLLAYMLHKIARRGMHPPISDFITHYRSKRPIILQNPSFHRQLESWQSATEKVYKKK